MTFLLFIITFYSLLVTGLLVRNHYRYEQVLNGEKPESENHVHSWDEWKFEETTRLFSPGTEDVETTLPIERRDRYSRKCKSCGEPEYKVLKK